MTKFLSYLNEAVNVDTAKFAASLQFLSNGKDFQKDVSDIVSTMSRTFASGQYAIADIGNGRFRFSSNLLPCGERQVYKDFTELVKQLLDDGYTTNRSTNSTLYIDNEELREEGFLWFMYIYILLLGQKGSSLLKSFKELEAMGVKLFNTTMRDEYVNAVKKAVEAGDKQAVITALRDTKSLNIKFVTNGKGNNMLRIDLGEISMQLANKVLNYRTIGSLLSDIFDVALSERKTRLFTYNEFVEALGGKFENAPESPQQQQGSTEEAQGGVSFKKMDEGAIADFKKRFPWFVSNKEVKGTVTPYDNAFSFTGDWVDGTWDGGDFKTGLIFRNGTFHNGVVKSGYFASSTFNGTWENGTWLSGDWFGGTWKAGRWVEGRIKSAKFRKAIPSNINPTQFKELESRFDKDSEYQFTEALQKVKPK